jgi:hypothetical protein
LTKETIAEISVGMQRQQPRHDLEGACTPLCERRALKVLLEPPRHAYQRRRYPAPETGCRRTTGVYSWKPILILKGRTRVARVRRKNEDAMSEKCRVTFTRRVVRASRYRSASLRSRPVLRACHSMAGVDGEMPAESVANATDRKRPCPAMGMTARRLAR